MCVCLCVCVCVCVLASLRYGGAVFNTHALDAEQWGACVAIALGVIPLRAAVTTALNARETNSLGGVNTPDVFPAAAAATEQGASPRSVPEHMPKMTLWTWLEMKLFRGIF